MDLLYTSGQITAAGTRDVLAAGFPEIADWDGQDLLILHAALALVASDRDERVWTVNLFDEGEGRQVAHVVDTDHVEAAAEVRCRDGGVVVDMRADAGLAMLPEGWDGF